MKPSQPTKRPRGHRGNGRRPNGGRNSNFESSGPQGKIRGTAYQVIEKYQALGRDALTFGDRVAAENYFQHAEHYYRVMVANGGLEQRNARPSGQQQDRQPTTPNQENAQQSSQAPEVEGVDQRVVSTDGGSAAIEEPERRISAEEGNLKNTGAESINA